MAVFDAPDLPLTQFRMGIRLPGLVVQDRPSGLFDAEDQGEMICVGTSTWSVSSRADRKKVTRLGIQLEGTVNQMKIVLPADYAPINTPPSGLVVTLSNITLNSDNQLVLEYTQTGGTWAPSVDDHINIGKRCYVIDSIPSSNSIMVSPPVRPSLNDDVEIHNPFVIVRLLGGESPTESLTEGWKYNDLTLEWVEQPFD